MTSLPRTAYTHLTDPLAFSAASHSPNLQRLTRQIPAAPTLSKTASGTSTGKDQAAEKQLTQMIDFIKLEAREKAEEIRAQANQDYEMERLMKEQQAKLKLQGRYAQIEQERITERRVAMSKKLSEQRTHKLAEQGKMLSELVEDTERRLVGFSSAEPAKYKQLMLSLLAQGALSVIGAGNGGSYTIRVLCRPCDTTLVEGLCKQASQLAARRFVHAAQADAQRREATKQSVLGKKLQGGANTAVRPPQLPEISVVFVVDSGNALADSSAGGIIATSRDGLIVADNTLEKRLHIAAAGLQPVLKQVVFPSSMPKDVSTPSAGAAHHGAEADLLGV